MKSTNVSFLFDQDILPRTKVIEENTESGKYNPEGVREYIGCKTNIHLREAEGYY